MKSVLQGQISLLDQGVLNNLCVQSSNKLLVPLAKEVVKEDYLKKGEKIISLLKSKGIREFKESSFFECFNFKTYSTKKGYENKLAYLKQCISNKIILPALDSPVTDLKEVLKEFGDKIMIDSLVEDSYEEKLLKGFLKGKSYHGGAAISFEGLCENFYMHFGKEKYINKKGSGRQWSIRGTSIYLRCIDGASFFRELVFFMNLRAVIQEMCLSKNSSLFTKLMNMQLEIVSRKSDKESGQVKIHKEISQMGYITSYLNKIEMPYLVYDDEVSSLCVLEQGDFNILYLLKEVIEPGDWKFAMARIREGKNIVREMAHGIDSMTLIDVFDLIYDEYIIDRDEYEFNKSLMSDYAKSYQTKKGINKKTVEAMEKSNWNNHFGYVEFDQDCDLALIEELEKEFGAIAGKFSWDKEEEVSLRFRRLGNHKAAGLYYSALKCICVDINNPSSLVHEYFHMLDYTNDRASRTAAFSSVYYRYKELIEQYAKTDDSIQGNSKYNKSYYLQPTEVFARCGEMYLVRVKEIDNSVVKTRDNFAYPNDEKLLAFITEYFDGFLKEVVA